MATLQHHSLQQAIAARLRRTNRYQEYTLEEVQQRNSKDCGFIVVEGKVYDITHHVQTHKGWTCGCAVSTLMATLRVLGTDCTEEVLQVHSATALKQLQPYMVGELVEGKAQQAQHAEQSQQGAQQAALQGGACPVAGIPEATVRQLLAMM